MTGHPIVNARAITPARVVLALSVATVLAQIAYPVVRGGARDAVTVAVVVLFAAASLAHAAASRGPRCLIAVFMATAVPGLAVELLGVHSGFPFGRYAYTGGLGPEVWDVPIVIALAWTMFAWPAALVARRLARSPVGRIVVGAWALASWDLFLDPQMVAAGHWRWAFPSPHLPGVASVPLTNYAGWLVVSLLISALLQTVLARTDNVHADDRSPYLLFVWTWLSSALALAAFLHRPAAAGWGLVGMGVVAVPFLLRLRAARASTGRLRTRYRPTRWFPPGRPSARR